VLMLRLELKTGWLRTPMTMDYRFAVFRSCYPTSPITRTTCRGIWAVRSTII